MWPSTRVRSFRRSRHKAGLYSVVTVPAGNLITINSQNTLTAGTESTSGMTAYPLVVHSVVRNSTLTLDMPGTWNVNNTTTNSAPRPVAAQFRDGLQLLLPEFLVSRGHRESGYDHA